MSIWLRRYWVVLLSLGAGCSSEPRDCTNIGCELPQMRFGTTSDVAPGDYEFRFVLDGVALTCHAVQGETDVLFDCRDGLPLRLTGTFRSGELSGFVAELFSTPQEVSVNLTLDGTLLVSEEFQPSYRQEMPNGPNCGTCTTADPMTFTFNLD